MTGIVKSVGKYALLAGSALALSLSAATAASLADAGMDKRVADLEREIKLLKNQMKSAMSGQSDKAIQSGNSRVKVTIYGQVNRAFRVASGGDNQYQSVDNDGSSSRLGFLASGAIDASTKISARTEVEWQDNRRSATNDGSEGNVRLRSRHVDLWIDNKDVGQLWMGHGSIAGDAADLFSMSGTSHIFSFGGPSGNDGIPAFDADGDVITTGTGDDEKNVGRAWVFGSFFGARENRIMYVTPNLMGARLRLSMGENKSVSAGLRYAGAPGGQKEVSMLLAAGYRSDPNEHSDTAERSTAWGISGGVKHNASGISLSGSYGTSKTRGSDLKPNKWAAELGWTGKMNDMGATSATVGYGIYDDDDLKEAKYYYVAVNQKIDAAAADIYAGVSHDTGTVKHTETGRDDTTCDANTSANATCAVKRKDVLIFLAGARIKF